MAANNNVYLELLKRQIEKLQQVINDKDKYPEDVYNCVLAGVLIQANAVLETCMIDFHSKDFEEVAAAIYGARQLLIHYSDYRTFDDVESISKDIIEKFNKVYASEKEYFEHILEYNDNQENNVVVRNGPEVSYDASSRCYIFKKDGVEIAVSASKVTVIQDYAKKKDKAYIINCESNMNCFYTQPDGTTQYVQLKAPRELQGFFINNFTVLNANYNKHKTMVRSVLDNFYSGKFDVVKTKNKPKKSGEQIWSIDTMTLLGDYFDKGVVYEEFIEDREYGNRAAPSKKHYDYSAIKGNVKNALLAHVSEKDYFFIQKAKVMMRDIEEKIKRNAHSLNSEALAEMQISILINFADLSIKNLSPEFIKAHKDFEHLYESFTKYRNFFAHNHYQLKPGLEDDKYLEEFLELSKGIMEVLSHLGIKNITAPIMKEEREFLLLEKSRTNFVNFKHEQYLKLDPATYIGDKLYYSSKIGNDGKIVALIPIEPGWTRTYFYEKKDGEFAPKTIRGQKDKMKRVPVERMDVPGAKKVNIDTNISDLLFINAAFEGVAGSAKMRNKLRNTGKKVVIFRESENNNNVKHAASLNHIITNYFQQKYLPLELACETSIRFVDNGKDESYFQILDSEGRVIADVVDDHMFRKYGMAKDGSQVFSVGDISYDFSKKRGIV